MTSKRCSKCRAVKPLDGFYKDGRNRTGRYSRCKACHIDDVKAARRAVKERATA